MRTIRMKALIAAVAGFLSIASTAHAQTCKGNAGVAIARLYSIAWSYPDAAPEFVRENASFFRPDGAAIGCGRALSSQLIATALSRPSSKEIDETAMDVATRGGHPELGPVIASDLKKSDLPAIGLYLQNLVDTSPALAQGNVGPYRGTRLYQTSQFVWQTMEGAGLFNAEVIGKLRNMTFQLNEWYLGKLLTVMP